ncbi:hypothetical protein Taro_022053 [Colocasia esculenta]|uniref:Uncharacterized protein n=1 Tax=Colocasia esculenta TaxID=4460 RepID=A0A843VDC0_COLES|nr:hypothetical protein [Colocasia esculenta]
MRRGGPLRSGCWGLKALAGYPFPLSLSSSSLLPLLPAVLRLPLSPLSVSGEEEGRVWCRGVVDLARSEEEVANQREGPHCGSFFVKGRYPGYECARVGSPCERTLELRGKREPCSGVRHEAAAWPGCGVVCVVNFCGGSVSPFAGVETRASGDSRSVSSRYRSSILGCQSVVALACMVLDLAVYPSETSFSLGCSVVPAGMPRVASTLCRTPLVSAGVVFVARSRLVVMALRFPAALADEGLVIPTGPCSRGSPPLLSSARGLSSREHGVRRVAEPVVAPRVVSSSESECCELLYPSVRLPCMIRVRAAGCSCCCDACLVSVVTRHVRAMVALLELDSLAVVFLMWRMLAGKSRCSVCCVASLVECCDTCLWLLSAWCWLVVSSCEVLLEFFSVGSGGSEGLRYAASVGLARAFWRVFPERCLGDSGGVKILPRIALCRSWQRFFQGVLSVRRLLAPLVEVLTKSASCVVPLAVCLAVALASSSCSSFPCFSVARVGLRVPVVQMVASFFAPCVLSQMVVWELLWFSLLVRQSRCFVFCALHGADVMVALLKLLSAFLCTFLVGLWWRVPFGLGSVWPVVPFLTCGSLHMALVWKPMAESPVSSSGDILWLPVRLVSLSDHEEVTEWVSNRLVPTARSVDGCSCVVFGWHFLQFGTNLASLGTGGNVVPFPHAPLPLYACLYGSGRFGMKHLVVCLPTDVAAAVRIATSVEASPCLALRGVEAGARLASRACGLRVPLLAASGGGLVAVVVTTFPHDVSKCSPIALAGTAVIAWPCLVFRGLRWSGRGQTRASGDSRSVSSRYRSSILGCQSVVAPACMVPNLVVYPGSEVVLLVGPRLYGGLRWSCLP